MARSCGRFRPLRWPYSAEFDWGNLYLRSAIFLPQVGQGRPIRPGAVWRIAPFRSRLEALPVDEASSPLPSEAEPILDSATPGNLLCDLKVITSVSARAVPSRLRYAYPPESSTASGTGSNLFRKVRFPVRRGESVGWGVHDSG